MKTRLGLVLMALAGLAIIAPAQGTKKPVTAKKPATVKVAAKKAAPKKLTAKKPVVKKATKPVITKSSPMTKKKS